jgi:tetratricopeptide (TPR) repeat protein
VNRVAGEARAMNRASIQSGRQSSAHEAPNASGTLRRSWRTKWAVIGLALSVAGFAVLVNSRPFRKFFEPGHAARDAVIRGQELLKHGRPRQALAVISGIRDGGPWKADLLTIKGLALSTLGEVEPSRVALESSLAIQPRQPMAAKVLSAIYFSRSENVKAIELLERAAAIDPDDFRPWYAIGEAFVRLGQPEDAATAFRHALDRKPTHVESRIGLLGSLLVIRPPEESSHLLGELLQTRPDDPKVQVLAAWHARALGQADRALEHAGKAVELDPNLLEAIVIRAQLNHVAGKSRLALADTERAVELDPNNLPGLNLLAQLQASMGQAEMARATFDRHRKVLERAELIRKLTLDIEKRPEDPEPRWKLGQSAAEGGITNLAISNFEAALALDPRCQPAIQGLRALGSEVRKSGSSLPQSSSLSLTIGP